MPRTLRTLLLLSLSLSPLPGCASAPDGGDEAVAEEAKSPAPSDMAAEPAVSEWEAWLAGALADVERDQPALVAELRALVPALTRDGGARFASDAVARPGAAPVLLDRLARGTDPAPVRVALADALSRTGGPYAAALVGLLAREADAEVRVAMVAALRRAAGEPALAGLRAGLADADPRVRAAAAETASRRQDGAALADALIAGLADDSEDVQIAAARSLGALKVAAAFPALQPKLSAGSAELRLHALRALTRIDRPRTSALPELVRLATDPDPRVADAAAKVRDRAAR